MSKKYYRFNWSRVVEDFDNFPFIYDVCGDCRSIVISSDDKNAFMNELMDNIKTFIEDEAMEELSDGSVGRSNGGALDDDDDDANGEFESSY
jgi:hypothetical protein